MIISTRILEPNRILFQGFCFDSLCGFLIHALANISIEDKETEADGGGGGVGDAEYGRGSAIRQDVGLSGQMAGKTLAGMATIRPAIDLWTVVERILIGIHHWWIVTSDPF